jgi:hypothetical protein
LVWLGLGLSIVAFGLTGNPFGMNDASRFFLGAFALPIAVLLYLLGIGVAGLGVIFAVWGFVVTLVHRTGAHILAGVALVLSFLVAFRALAPWLTR